MELLNVEVLRALVRDVVRDELGKAVRDDGYMTVAEAAAVARLKSATLREWIKRGRLKATHLGRRLRVTRADLDAAMAKPARRKHADSIEARALRESAKVLGQR